jgi:hypothetical protein
VLTQRALKPLRHAAIEFAERIDLRLELLDAKEAGFDVTKLDWPAGCPGTNNDYRRDALGRTQMVDANWSTRSFVDAEKRRAIIWFTDASAAPDWVLHDQVRNALHWAAFRGHFGLFHAAALRFDNVGCLIAGKSGSGKSTLTAAAVDRGFQTAGDDFVLIDVASTPRAYAIFDTIRLYDASLAQFQRYQPYVTNKERRAEDKNSFHLLDVAPEYLASGFPLHVVLHAALVEEPQSRIVKSTAAAAFLSLAPSSLLLLRTQNKRVSANCARLLAQIPAYEFQIGNDVQAAADELAAFLSTVKS